MPALPPVAGVVKLRVVGDNNGAVWNTLFHWRYSGAGALSGDVAAMAGKVLREYQLFFGPITSSRVGIDRCEAVDLSSNLAPSAVVVLPAPGSATGLPAPAQVALVISWQIVRRYRGGHPRTYLAGLSDRGIQDSRSFKPLTVAAAQVGATLFLRRINAFVLPTATNDGLVCVHYRQNGVSLRVPLVDPILGTTARGEIHTQRRRLA